jgi:DNA-binding transcriptional LysR family regulator
MTNATLERLKRWDDIPFLLAVLRSGSFTKAAEALGTEQSTVSRRISALEEELGVVLFERGSRAPSPTATALALREVAENIEAEVGRFTDAASEESKQLVRGRVRLALTDEMASYFVIPHILPRLRDAYPELRIDLVTGYRASDLMGHEADVALRFFRTERGDLVGKKIGQLSTAILCQRSLKRKFTKRDPQSLPWVVVELESLAALETQWIESVLGAAPVLACSSYHVQLEAIRAGLGVGIAPRIVPELDPEFAAFEPLGVELPRLELYLFTRRSIQKLPRIRVVLDALERELSAFTDEGRLSKAKRKGC